MAAGIKSYLTAISWSHRRTSGGSKRRAVPEQLGSRDWVKQPQDTSTPMADREREKGPPVHFSSFGSTPSVALLFFDLSSPVGMFFSAIRMLVTMMMQRNRAVNDPLNEPAGLVNMVRCSRVLGLVA